MPTAAHLRAQIEATLASRIPSALTLTPRIFRSVVPTGIASLDHVLEGGLPVGAITEIAGPQCSGRTTLVLSILAGITRAARVCAWVDVSDALDPESTAAAGVNLERLLWVRCGVADRKKAQPVSPRSFAVPGKYLVPAPIPKGLHGGGFGPHPRGEVKGLPDAIHGFLGGKGVQSRRADSTPGQAAKRDLCDLHPAEQPSSHVTQGRALNPWRRIEQALCVVDLLLQAGGFSAVVLDMGNLAPEYALRIPLATWFRYRAAAERSQTSLLLLTQQACARSSAGLVLNMQAGNPLQEEATVLTGAQYGVEVVRERFKVVPVNVVSMRKPPQMERGASWQSRTAWAGLR